jgi:small subunit ribosomal protein S21
MDRAIRLLKRKMVAEGVFKALQDKRHYEKPSDKKRRLKRAAIVRARKADRERGE